jgi:hypothetical protein
LDRKLAPGYEIHKNVDLDLIEIMFETIDIEKQKNTENFKVENSGQNDWKND